MKLFLVQVFEESQSKNKCALIVASDDEENAKLIARHGAMIFFNAPKVADCRLIDPKEEGIILTTMQREQ